MGVSGVLKLNLVDLRELLKQKWVIVEEIQKKQHSYRNKPSSKKRSRNYSLMRMYGIDTNVYNQILESQNYACAICGSNEIGTKHQKNFHVDHCHTTKKVRGLLCKPCNILLGESKDDPSILYRAADYLMGVKIL